jgi:hypothetical protein
MHNVYNLLRESCGLSQQEAADFHDVRLDTLKSWCSGRRPAPVGAIDELKELSRDIMQAGKDVAALLKRTSKDGAFIVVLPRDDKDARACGFPSMTAQMRAIAIAVAQLPDEAEIRLVEGARGSLPSAIMQRSHS